jgi:hypothetical protein
MMRLWPALPALILALLLGAPLAPAAAEGTPAAGPAPGVRCSDITPRNRAFFSGIEATPIPAARGTATFPALEAGTPETYALPPGTPADEETVANIQNVYQHLIACLNAGDYLRLYALYTDGYLVRNLSDVVLSRVDATPAPVPASTESNFDQVLGANVLADGRIAALVSTTNPLTGRVVIFSILQEADDHLLIDEERVVAAPNIPGTPSS